MGAAVTLRNFLTCAGVNAAFLDKTLETLFDVEVVEVQDLSEYRQLFGLDGLQIKPLSMARIIAALDVFDAVLHAGNISSSAAETQSSKGLQGAAAEASQPQELALARVSSGSP